MPSNTLIPNVIEKSSEGERVYDLESRLLRERIIYICDEVNSASMKIAIEELMYLDSLEKGKKEKTPIFMYINSPGGSVIDGLALVDTMRFISTPVYTFVIGTAASMGSVILSAGEKGHRHALPSSQVLVHQMSGGTKGATKDNVNAIHYEQRLEYLLLSELGLNCGKISQKTHDEIRKAIMQMDDREYYPEKGLGALSEEAKAEFKAFKETTDYDHWLFADQALEFGIIDKIISKEEDLA